MTKPPITRKLRCAVYTRKSTEEGLEQEFNSLHAQREACEAYVASQRSEGWALIREPYDDGGFSGGTLERPALKRLLADIVVGLADQRPAFGALAGDVGVAGFALGIEAVEFLLQPLLARLAGVDGAAQAAGRRLAH